ncbi:MAG: hypothetical protein ACI9U2_000029 [Bradymonadia bacterium]|jgi:hypothetical protein
MSAETQSLGETRNGVAPEGETPSRSCGEPEAVCRQQLIERQDSEGLLRRPGKINAKR